MHDALFDGLLLISAKSLSELRAASSRLRDMSAAAVERANDAEERSRALRELFVPPKLAADADDADDLIEVPASECDAQQLEPAH